MKTEAQVKSLIEKTKLTQRYENESSAKRLITVFLSKIDWAVNKSNLESGSREIVIKHQISGIINTAKRFYQQFSNVIALEVNETECLTPNLEVLDKATLVSDQYITLEQLKEIIS